MNSPKLLLDTHDLVSNFEASTQDMPIMDRAGEFVLEMLMEHLVEEGDAFKLNQPIIGDIYSIVPRDDITLTMEQTTTLYAAIDALGRGVLEQLKSLGVYTKEFDYYPCQFHRGNMVLSKF